VDIEALREIAEAGGHTLADVVPDMDAETEARVAAARRVQTMRAERLRLWSPLNADLTREEIERVVHADAEGKRLLAEAMDQVDVAGEGFGAENVLNAYLTILRLARTIADLDRSENVSAPHLAKAIRIRMGTPGKMSEDPSAPGPTLSLALGRAITGARERAGISPQDLALRLGHKNDTTVRQWEAGMWQRPSIETFLKVVGACREALIATLPDGSQVTIIPGQGAAL
jgi:DNA-binding transcriptional regulator YiaG